MSQQVTIEWDKFPRATHFTDGKDCNLFEGVGVFWRVINGVAQDAWLLDKRNTHLIRPLFPHDAQANMIPRPAPQPDWAAYPRATHFLPKRLDGSLDLDAFVRMVGGVVTDCWTMLDDGVQHYTYPTINEYDRSRMIKRPNVPDWRKAPDDATHWGPQSADGRWYEGWYKPEKNAEGFWLRADKQSAEGKWNWREWGRMEDERRAMLIERPKAEAFGPVDFSGPVMDFKTPAGLVTELIEAYQCEADRSTYRVGLVDDLRAMIKAGVFDPAAPGADKTVTTTMQGGKVIAVWDGSGRPPVDTVCWVTPHNTQWGFDTLDARKVRVLGYFTEHIWLVELYSDNSPAQVFVTTRTDKVDFEVYKSPEQIATDKRISAVKEWLKGVERDYGEDVAGQCEDILMQAESRMGASQ